MRLRGARRQEWLVAALVLTTSAASTWLLHERAREVDATSERRRAQLERLEELSHATMASDRTPRTVAGLFVDHEVIVAQAPWGTHLALGTDARVEHR